MIQNPRIRRCAELEYILLGDLRDLLEEPADAETAHWLVVVLDALLETLPEEYALKSDCGYLNEVVESLPQWNQKVADLEDEYFQLFRKLSRLKNQVCAGSDFQRIAKQISLELQEWMKAFVRHHRQEREIVTLAATYEIGGDG